MFPYQTYLLKFGSIYPAISWTFHWGCPIVTSHLPSPDRHLLSPHLPHPLCSPPQLVLASCHRSSIGKPYPPLCCNKSRKVVASVTWGLQNWALLSIFGVIALVQVHIMSFTDVASSRLPSVQGSQLQSISHFAAKMIIPNFLTLSTPNLKNSPASLQPIAGLNSHRRQLLCGSWNRFMGFASNIQKYEMENIRMHFIQKVWVLFCKCSFQF